MQANIMSTSYGEISNAAITQNYEKMDGKFNLGSCQILD